MTVFVGDEELGGRVADEPLTAALHQPGHVTATGSSDWRDAGFCYSAAWGGGACTPREAAQAWPCSAVRNQHISKPVIFSAHQSVIKNLLRGAGVCDSASWGGGGTYPS